MDDDVDEEDRRQPRRRLDELLDELQTRVDAVRGSRDQVTRLLEAVLSVGRELDLPKALRQIVESAAVLVPEPLRISEILQHPASSGFPPDHPPMHSFLGVPIRVRDGVFGNLNLAGKRDGRDFDGEDETALRTLAVAAGVAIENARLSEAVRDRQRWMEANTEVVGALLSGTDEMDVLHRIVGHAGSILGADLGVVALPEAGGADLRVMIAVGVDAEEHQGLVLPREGSFMGAAMAAGGPISTAEIRKDCRVVVGPPRYDGLGPVVAVPMMTDDAVLGVLLLAREDRAAPFTEAETEPLLAFAGQAALAMELAERRRAAEQMALLEDRDRIARDLHDLAIQRLFATGMTLQSMVRFVDHPEAGERLLRAVDDLDETIKIIRSTVFGLRARDAERSPQGLRARAAATIENAARTLGFTPGLRMEGLLDTDVPPAVVEDAVAVLAEALSNVARHAWATTAEVSLVVSSGMLVVTVTDDGVGFPADGHRSGLRNVAERAQRLGGVMETGPGPGGGARLLWKVPVT